MAERQIRVHESSAAASVTTSAHASYTASATVTTPLSPPAVPTDSSSSKVQRSRILAADPELDTVRKFNQGAAYTPLHPCLQEVQGLTAHEYTPMFIPKSMQHDARFSFHSLPNSPATNEPNDVIPFLNELFIPDEFIELLYKKTLEYIQSKEWKKVYKINKGDIIQFFAIMYYMGYAKLPSKEDYWDDQGGLTPPSPVCTQRGMSYRKFQFIWRNLYAVTPQGSDEPTEETVDGLPEEPTEAECRTWARQAEPFIALLNRVSKLVCRWPSFKISIDEMMSRFKGRSVETYRMKKKPIKSGFKFFALCCATTGFVWHLLPHGRVSDTKQTGAGVTDQFLKLIKTLPGPGKDRTKKYVVGADNYFTYPEVLTKCRDEGVSVVGTARARKGWPPKEIASVKDDRFNTVYFMKTKDNYLIARWVDNNVVTMVTTHHDPTDAIKKCRRRPRTNSTNKKHVDEIWGEHPSCNVWIPVIIDDYNHFMLGVDVADQLIAYYRPNVRCRRTWMPLMLHWLNCTRVNSFITHKGVCGKARAFSQKIFLITWIKHMLARAHKADVDKHPSPVTRSRSVEVAKRYCKIANLKRFRFKTVGELSLPRERLLDPLRHHPKAVDKQNKCTYCRYLNLRDRRDRPDQPDTWRKVRRPRKTCSECGYYLCDGVCFEEFHKP